MPESLSHLPTIALTMGDPAGIGPEIVLKALADPAIAPLARWTVVGDGRVLQMAEQFTGLKPVIGEPRAESELRNVDTLGDLSGFAFGRIDARCGAAAVEYVRVATELCLGGEADAMVTAPLNKEAVA